MLNVLKSGYVVVADNVYTIVSNDTGYDIQDPFDTVSQQSISSSMADEDAMLQRLTARLDDERKAILKAANEEAGFIKNQAYHAGYADGITEKVKDIEKLIHQTQSVLQDMSDMLNKRLDDYEENLTILATDVASKILARKIDQDDLIVTELIRKTVDEVKNAEWIKVTLSEKLADGLREIHKELHAGMSAGNIDIITKDVPKGTCIVETPNSIIDASIHTQLENLKALFIK